MTSERGDSESGSGVRSEDPFFALPSASECRGLLASGLVSSGQMGSSLK